MANNLQLITIGCSEYNSDIVPISLLRTPSLDTRRVKNYFSKYEHQSLENPR